METRTWVCPKCGWETNRLDSIVRHWAKKIPCVRHRVLFTTEAMECYLKGGATALRKYKPATASIVTTDVANMSDFDGLSITGSEAAHMTNNAL
jgi:hypothetical protein